MVAALDGGDIALIVLAAFWGLLVLFLCVVLLNTFRVLESTKMLIDGDPRGDASRSCARSRSRSRRRTASSTGWTACSSRRAVVGRVERISGLVEQAVSSPLVKVIGARRRARRARSRFRGGQRRRRLGRTSCAGSSGWRSGSVPGAPAR